MFGIIPYRIQFLKVDVKADYFLFFDKVGDFLADNVALLPHNLQHCFQPAVGSSSVYPWPSTPIVQVDNPTAI